MATNMAAEAEFRPWRARKLSVLLAVVGLLLVGCSSEGSDENVAPADAATDAEADDTASPADVAATPTESEAQEQLSLRVAAGSLGIPYLQLWAAEEAGIYADNGLTVEVVEVQGAANATAAVESGDVDLMVTLPEAVLTAQAAGSDITMVSSTVDESVYRLYANPEIESLDDLEGGTIAMLVEGNGTHIQAQWLMDEHGPGDESVTYVASGGLGDRLAALLNGQVDATILFPPFDIQAEDEGMVPLTLLADYVDGYPNEVVSGKKENLEEKAAAVRAFNKSLIEAAQWLIDNRDEAIELTMSQFGLDRSVAERAYDFTAPYLSTTGAVSESGLEWTAEIMEGYAGLSGLPELSEVYDPSYLP